jgi:hypothetical protein
MQSVGQHSFALQQTHTTHLLYREQRDSLIPSSPNIEQIADEIGMPFERLSPLNYSQFTLTLPSTLRRSLRHRKHYIAPSFVCECPHSKHVANATLIPQPTRSDRDLKGIVSPLFIAEDKPLSITCEQKAVQLNRQLTPYHTPFASAPHTGQHRRNFTQYNTQKPARSGNVQRSMRHTKHYIAPSYVCECPHTRQVK